MQTVKLANLSSQGFDRLHRSNQPDHCAARLAHRIQRIHQQRMVGWIEAPVVQMDIALCPFGWRDRAVFVQQVHFRSTPFK